MIFLDILTAIFIGLIGGMLTVWVRSLIGDPTGDGTETGDVNTRAIFSFIGVFVLHRYLKYENRLREYLEKSNLTLKQERPLEARKINRWKIFTCPFCMVVWMCFAFGPLMIWITGISWWHMLYIPSMGHLFLKAYLDKFE